MSLSIEENKQLHKYNTRKEDLIFHPISWHGYDVDADGDEDDSEEESGGYYSDEENQRKEFRIRKSYRILMYGRTQRQEAVSLVINDFKPYFYFRVEDNWTPKVVNYLKDKMELNVETGRISYPYRMRDSDRDDIQTKLEKKEKRDKYKKFVKARYTDEIISCEIEKWEKLYWFTNHKKYNFIKVTTKSADGVRFFSDMIKNGIQLNKFFGDEYRRYEVYLANLDPILCFIHDQDLQPSSWMRVPACKYYRGSSKDLYVGHDFTTKSVNCLPYESPLLPEFRVASYDIEAVSEDGTFPQADRPNDKVIQIGTTYHKYGSKDCYKKTIVVLGECDDIEGVEVYRCKTEKDVILRWAQLIRETDPDIITGYNIWGFDWSFLYERAKFLKCDDKFMMLARRKSTECKFINKKLESSAMGVNFLKYVEMEGRCQIDLYKLVMRDYKLGSYKLDAVSEHFLGDHKVDLKPHELFDKFKEFTSKSICDIATYCVQDCELCNRLMNKLEVLPNNLGMSNVCFIPFYWLFYRGQGIKIFSLVAKLCKQANILVPMLDKNKNKRDAADDEADDDDSYEGAIVLVATPGVYMNPVSCLDFASLYPSTMNAENLSHNSLCLIETYDQGGNHIPSLDRGNRDLLVCDGYHYNVLEYDNFTGKGDDKVITGKSKCYFMELDEAVDDLSKKDIIPLILQKLLGARKSTRKSILHKKVICNDGTEVFGFMDEKEETYDFTTPEGKKVSVLKTDVKWVGDRFSEFQKKVLDGLQLAYKMTANSLYGQCGAPTSDIYFKEIAASTTAGGRDRLRDARDKAETNYPGAVCVYGDTDSIFVNFQKYWEDVEGLKLEGRDALVHSIELGIKCSKEISATLKKPHDLEYEKTFMPFIQFAKKRYEGLLYEEDPDKCHHKSMGTVLKRRDNAPIVKRIFGGCVDIVLRERNFDRLQEFFINEVRNLLDGNMPMEDLIISKTLKANYKNPDSIAHKALADRMGERDPGNKPQSNDRIPYVYIDIGVPKRGQKVLQGDKVEHPEYIMENKDKIKPDYMFYLTNQVKAPCMQLFGLILEHIHGYKENWVDWSKLNHLSEKKFEVKMKEMREKEAERLLLSRIINDFNVKREGGQSIMNFFSVLPKGEKPEMPENIFEWVKPKNEENDIMIKKTHKIDKKVTEKKDKKKETKKKAVNKALTSLASYVETVGGSSMEVLGMMKQAGEFKKLEKEDDKVNKILKLAEEAKKKREREELLSKNEIIEKINVTEKFAPKKNVSNAESKVEISVKKRGRPPKKQVENIEINKEESPTMQVKKVANTKKEETVVVEEVKKVEEPKKIIVKVKKTKNIPITLRKKKVEKKEECA